MSYANSETLIKQALARLNQYRQAVGEQPLANLPAGELKNPRACALALGLESARYPGALVYYDGIACASEEQVATLLRAWPDVRRDHYRERWVNNPLEWREFVFHYDRGELTNIAPSTSPDTETLEPEAGKERSAIPGNDAGASNQVLKPGMRSRDKHPPMPVVNSLFGEAPLSDSVMLPSATSAPATPHEIKAACNHRPSIESLCRESPSMAAHLSLTKCALRELRSNDSTMSEDQTTVAGDAPCATSNLSNDTEAVMTDQSMTSNGEFAPTEAPLTTESIAIPDTTAAKGAVSAPEAANTSIAPSTLSDEPYIWAQCTIQVSMQILPESDHSSGDRRVILGVRTHEDAPLLALIRLSDLEPLPLPLTELLTQLAAQLPERAAAATERKRLAEEKTKAEEAKRREATARAQAKRAVTVVKTRTKTKSASSLNTLVHHAEPQTTSAPNAAITERTRTTPLIEAAPPASTLQPEPPAPTSETPLERHTTFGPSKSETSSGKIGDGQPSLF